MRLLYIMIQITVNINNCFKENSSHCADLKLVEPLDSRYKDDSDTPVEEGGKPKVQYGVEFTFDADARVAITLYCQAFEEFTNGMAV